MYPTPMHKESECNKEESIKKMRNHNGGGRFHFIMVQGIHCGYFYLLSTYKDLVHDHGSILFRENVTRMNRKVSLHSMCLVFGLN